MRIALLLGLLLSASVAGVQAQSGSPAKPQPKATTTQPMTRPAIRQVKPAAGQSTTTMPQVQLPRGEVQVQQTPKVVLDRRALYQNLVEARERAEREAAARAERERAEARDAAARERESRRLALGHTEKYGQGDDCDDSRRDVNPLAAEVCDLVDNNCDGRIDEDQTFRMFLDGDGDGHGDPSRPVDVCPVEQQRAAAEGRWLVPTGNDCDDEDPDRWRGCE